jgi:alpha-aminoadipic semialdehyde synthase
MYAFRPFSYDQVANKRYQVPFGMKFSWSPRGLLSAALNDARFKLNSKVSPIRNYSLLHNI